MTIRDNILFGRELDVDRYNEVVEICQLGNDLDVLDGGDLTEIGEKGINLSGGQKARLSIARAVYADRDIILMDDPLSALDAHVKKKVFDRVFCKELKGKTRILVTHALDCLPKVDRIIIMNKGQIDYDGTFDDLVLTDFYQNIKGSLDSAHMRDESSASESDRESIDD